VASPAEPAAPKPEPKPEPKPAKEDPAKFLDNPIVRAEIAKQAKLAAKQAREEAAAEAAQAAERAQMAESDRLRAEKADAEKAKLEAKTAADNAIRRAGIYKAVLDGKYALQDGGSDYLEYSVGNLLQANPDMDISEAVAQTVQSSPFMLIPETPVAPVAAQETPALAASPVPKPTTAPVEHHAQSKTKEKPVDGVDTLNMTAAEYRLYKAKTYGG
jgi:hypothetical protein